MGAVLDAVDVVGEEASKIAPTFALRHHHEQNMKKTFTKLSPRAHSVLLFSYLYALPSTRFCFCFLVFSWSLVVLCICRFYVVYPCAFLLSVATRTHSRLHPPLLTTSRIFQMYIFLTGITFGANFQRSRRVRVTRTGCVRHKCWC